MWALEDLDTWMDFQFLKSFSGPLGGSQVWYPFSLRGLATSQRHLSTSSLHMFFSESSFLKVIGVSALGIQEEIGSNGELSICLSFWPKSLGMVEKV